MLGNYKSLFEARSVSAELRIRRGGGIVTSLLIYGLEDGIIKRALVVKSSKKEPYAEAAIAQTINEVKEAAGSKYTFVPHGVLLKKLDNDSAIVGLPCQIKQCRSNSLKIGLFCGLNLSPRGLDYLLRKLRVKKEEIDELDYRAPGGGLLVKLKDGRTVTCKSYSWMGYFFPYRKCLHCVDHTNHWADISVGDDKLGWSLVIVRTDRGKNLFLNAVGKGYIEANQVDRKTFLSKAMIGPLVQKEMNGGYINSKLVRVHGKWIELMPLYALRRAGEMISHYIKISSESSLTSSSTFSLLFQKFCRKLSNSIKLSSEM